MAGEILTPGSVHYTDAKTPYGPFKAGPEGLTLMVIRPSAPKKGPRTPVRTPSTRSRPRRSATRRARRPTSPQG